MAKEGLEADFITFDGKLLHLPEGFSTLAIRDGREEEIGSEMATLEKACAMALDKVDHYMMEVGRLRDLLEQKLAALGGEVFFQTAHRLPNCVVIAFEGVHAEHLLFHLQREGIFATTGEGTLSKVLKCCQVNGTSCHSAISFALSDETTEEEVHRVVKTIESLLAKLRAYGENIDAVL